MEKKSEFLADRFCKTSCKLNGTHQDHQQSDNEQTITAKIPAKVNAQDLQERKCNSEHCWECTDVLC
ncbi:MAG: hypothetical protein MJ060_02185 [Clostridia bacterium]|nr:hypothetical protein [Clostridia bacterium]